MLVYGYEYVKINILHAWIWTVLSLCSNSMSLQNSCGFTALFKLILTENKFYKAPPLSWYVEDTYTRLSVVWVLCRRKKRLPYFCVIQQKHFPLISLSKYHWVCSWVQIFPDCAEPRRGTYGCWTLHSLCHRQQWVWWSWHY